MVYKPKTSSELQSASCRHRDATHRQVFLQRNLSLERTLAFEKKPSNSVTGVWRLKGHLKSTELQRLKRHLQIDRNSACRKDSFTPTTSDCEKNTLSLTENGTTSTTRLRPVKIHKTIERIRKEHLRGDPTRNPNSSCRQTKDRNMNLVHILLTTVAAMQGLVSAHPVASRERTDDAKVDGGSSAHEERDPSSFQMTVLNPPAAERTPVSAEVEDAISPELHIPHTRRKRRTEHKLQTVDITSPVEAESDQSSLSSTLPATTNAKRNKRRHSRKGRKSKNPRQRRKKNRKCKNCRKRKCGRRKGKTTKSKKCRQGKSGRGKTRRGNKKRRRQRKDEQSTNVDTSSESPPFISNTPVHVLYQNATDLVHKTSKTLPVSPQGWDLQHLYGMSEKLTRGGSGTGDSQQNDQQPSRSSSWNQLYQQSVRLGRHDSDSQSQQPVDASGIALAQMYNSAGNLQRQPVRRGRRQAPNSWVSRY